MTSLKKEKPHGRQHELKEVMGWCFALCHGKYGSEDEPPINVHFSSVSKHNRARVCSEGPTLIALEDHVSAIILCT